MKCKSRKCRRKIDWRDWVLGALILMLAVVLYGIWYSRWFRALEYRECDKGIHAYEPAPEMNRTQIIEAVSELTETNYKVVWDRNNDYDGWVVLNPFDNRVFLNETQGNNDIVWTFTHEVLHKKLYSANERFVEFETFKVLYESGNQYFQDVALWRASIMWKGDKEYDCTWYILEYLDVTDTNVGEKYYK